MRDSEARERWLDKALERLEVAMPVGKDCPVCGHKTLMQQKPWAIDLATGKTAVGGFYCYVCGKTFKEGVKLEEVNGQGS